MDAATLQLLIALGGVVVTAISSYIAAGAAVKVALAVHETRLGIVEVEVKGLRESRHHQAEVVSALQLELMRNSRAP